MKRMICGAIVCGVCALLMPGFARAEGAATAASEKGAKLILGQSAPEIDAVTLDGAAGAAAKLANFAGKPVVMQFGSISEPVFRMRVADVEKMAGKYGDKVVFLTVYAHESHPADTDKAIEVNAAAGYSVTKPVTLSERMKLAAQAIERLGIKNQKVVVDAWSNASALTYGDYPNMTFVIDAKGNLQAGYPWMDPSKVQGAVNALLAGKAVPAEFRGKTEPSAPGRPDLTAAAMEMGGRGGGLSTVLDNLKLTDKQKEAVYPALGDYLAKARDFREKMGGGPANAGKGSTDTTAKTVDADEARKTMENLRASAKKLKEAVETNLSAEDAKKVMDVLERGPARRMFE